MQDTSLKCTEQPDSYTLYQHVPYENESVVCYGTLAEIKEYLHKRGLTSLDDFGLYSNNAPDIYELMKE